MQTERPSDMLKSNTLGAPFSASDSRRLHPVIERQPMPVLALAIVLHNCHVIVFEPSGKG